jgi:beta-lactamase superfamily II metal-dependent hydrolase
VIKLPHHGSKRDCTDDSVPLFFDDRNQCYGIISANSHPDGSVVDWLSSKGIRPLCTNFSKRWLNNSTVVDFINTTGLDASLKKGRAAARR